jgi:hypothetical protein
VVLFWSIPIARQPKCDGYWNGPHGWNARNGWNAWNRSLPTAIAGLLMSLKLAISLMVVVSRPCALGLCDSDCINRRIGAFS